MECHKCEHQADVLAGKYAAAVWDQSPCAACTLDERDSTFTLEFDPERDTGLAKSVVDQAAEGFVPVSAVVGILAMLWDMPPKVQRIIRGRMAKQTYAEIGEALGISAARVEWLHQRAMTRWPALRAMFPVKAARARRKEAEQGDNKGKSA